MRNFNRFLFIVGIISLALSTVASALAQDGPGNGRGGGRGVGQEDRGPRHATGATGVTGATGATGAISPSRGPGGLRARAIHGDIIAISGALWTVDRAGEGHDGESYVVDVSSAVIHWPDRYAPALSDFRVGDTVNVQFARGSFNPLRARAVHFVPREGNDDDDQGENEDRGGPGGD